MRPNPILSTRHQSLLRLLRLSPQLRLRTTLTFLINKSDERGADDDSDAEQDQVDGAGVVAEGLVCEGVEAGLREVEEACEADDQAVDFAEGCEAEDFGGVVAGMCVSSG